MIVIVATFKAKAGCEQDLQIILEQMIPNVQQEEGTLLYTLHRAKKDAGKFLFYEMYQDKAALDFHSSQDYFKEFLTKIDELLEEKLKIEVYEDLASIKR